MSETATNTKYNKNIVNPRPLFIRQRKQAMDMMTKRSIMKRMEMEHTIPTLLTSTGFWYTMPKISQGTGSLENNHLHFYFHGIIHHSFCL
jgi:hypothetical protein